MNNEDLTEELYYQSVIKRYFKHIMLTVGLVTSLAFIYETKQYYDRKQTDAAQALYELYIVQPNSVSIKQFITKHPHTLQTQLVLLQEAHNQFYKGQVESAIESLIFVTKNCQDKGLTDIALLRLASLYRHQGDNEKAQEALSLVHYESAYVKIQHALTLPLYSDEREKALHEAYLETDSLYLQHMITVANNDNIEII